MRFSSDKLKRSPAFVRAAPFIVFVVLTFLQGKLGEESRYWIYLAKTVVGGWSLWVMRPFVSEMKWQLSRSAVIIGIAVFIMWIGLDELCIALGVSPDYLKFDQSGNDWNPAAQFSSGTGLAWLFISTRMIGSVFIVPPLEEVFYRSFLYRYIAHSDFQAVPIGQFKWMPFVVTSVIFGFTHFEWFAGMLCGFAYQGLVCWKKRLGDAIVAHAITNLLLGIWVVWRGAWHFW